MGGAVPAIAAGVGALGSFLSADSASSAARRAFKQPTFTIPPDVLDTRALQANNFNQFLSTGVFPQPHSLPVGNQFAGQRAQSFNFGRGGPGRQPFRQIARQQFDGTGGGRGFGGGGGFDASFGFGGPIANLAAPPRGGLGPGVGLPSGSPGGGNLFGGISGTGMANLLNAIIPGLGGLVNSGQPVPSGGSQGQQAVETTVPIATAQHGGSLRRGLPTLVGERGPELILPGGVGGAGQVIPNDQLGGPQTIDTGPTVAPEATDAIAPVDPTGGANKLAGGGLLQAGAGGAGGAGGSSKFGGAPDGSLGAGTVDGGVTGGAGAGVPGLFGFSTPLTESVQSRFREFTSPEFFDRVTLGGNPFEVANLISETTLPQFENELGRTLGGVASQFGQLGNRLGTDLSTGLRDTAQRSFDARNAQLASIFPQLQSNFTTAASLPIQAALGIGGLEQAERFLPQQIINQFSTAFPGNVPPLPTIGASGIGSALTSGGGALAIMPLLNQLMQQQQQGNTGTVGGGGVGNFNPGNPFIGGGVF
jgi:hypothetical protein